jgi:hypothetical protein
MIRPGIVFYEVEMFIQFVESGGVENVRARFGTIERKQANVIVADLTPNHRACRNCRHHIHFGTFPANAKRREELQE